MHRSVRQHIERESGCQPMDRGWPEYALTDLDDRPLGRSATVDGVFDTPEPQPRPWRVLGAQPSGPLAVALDRPTTDQSHLDRYFPGSESARYHRKKHVSRLDVAVLGRGSLPEHEARDVVRKAPARIAENSDFDGADLVTW
jgi:hypothetical protein